MNRDRRPIIHDSAYPVAGGRDRRRVGARDDGPLDARAALADHMRNSMGADDYAKACILLGYFERALLGPDAGEGESESPAMDGRALDREPSELSRMFPASPNPRLAPHAGARDRDPNERLDPQAGELAKMFPDSANPSSNFR